MEDKTLVFVFGALLLVLGFVLGATLFSSTKVIEVEKQVVVEVPVLVNNTNDKTDRLCELTDGCNFYEISDSEADVVRQIVEDEEKEFIEAFSDFVGIDEDYLEIDDVDEKDVKVIALTKQDKEDENFEVKLFYRVEYKDSDEEDLSVIYIVVSSTLDEGEFDSLSLEEVSRTFEFE